MSRLCSSVVGEVEGCWMEIREERDGYYDHTRNALNCLPSANTILGSSKIHSRYDTFNSQDVREK